MADHDLDVPTTLRALRKRAGLTLGEMAEALDLAGPSSYQRYEDPKKFKRHSLPVPAVSRLARRLEGLGDPPITREEIWQLSGLPGGELAEIHGDTSLPLGFRFEPARYIPGIPGILRSGSMKIDKDLLMLLAFLVSEMLPIDVMPKKPFNILTLLLMIHETFEGLRDRLLPNGKFDIDHAIDLLEKDRGYIDMIMGMALGAAKVLRAVEIDQRNR